MAKKPGFASPTQKILTSQTTPMDKNTDPNVLPLLVFTSMPTPPTRVPTSWMELALQGSLLQFQAKVGEQRILLLFQDPAYLALIKKQSVDQVVMGMGNQVWHQALLHAQLSQSWNPNSTEDLNTLMTQIFLSLPFLLIETYMPSS